MDKIYHNMPGAFDDHSKSLDREGIIEMPCEICKNGRFPHIDYIMCGVCKQKLDRLPVGNYCSYCGNRLRNSAGQLIKEI